jgi:hypothetical protein
MDDFTMTGDSFDEALIDLEKYLKRCRETNIALRNDKLFMIMTRVIVLGHHVYVVGLKVDLAKIEVIVKMSHSTNQKRV